MSARRTEVILLFDPPRCAYSMPEREAQIDCTDAGFLRVLCGLCYLLRR